MNTFCRQHRYLVENIYCVTSIKTAEKCVQFAQYKLMNQGEHFFIEVPFDQYEAIIAQRSISQYSAYIKQGAFTYSQLKHIAEAGNIHHLHINAEGDIYFTDEVISMSTAIAFAQSKWNGAERYEAIENSVYTGLSIIGEDFAEEIIANEMPAESNIKSLQVKHIFDISKQKVLPKKKSCLYINHHRITGAYITNILTAEKMSDLVNEQLAPVQLFKTVAKTMASLLGGLVGILLGGSVGFFIPNVSTAVMTIIGGMIGLVGGSRLATTVSRKVLGWFVPTEMLHMLKIFKEQLMRSSEEFLLSGLELKQALHDFHTLHDLHAQLQLMANSDDPQLFAQQLIESELTRVVRLRMYLHVPLNHEMYEMLELLSITKRKGAVA